MISGVPHVLCRLAPGMTRTTDSIPITALIAPWPSTLLFQPDGIESRFSFSVGLVLATQIPGQSPSFAHFAAFVPLNCLHNATAMAIGDIPSSPQQATPPQPIDIEAWTEQATVALSSVTISTPGDAHQGFSVALVIPLDDHDAPSIATRPVGAAAAAKAGGYYQRKAPLRRDSLVKREALLKGKEGSKRRQRWENGTFP